MLAFIAAIGYFLLLLRRSPAITPVTSNELKVLPVAGGANEALVLRTGDFPPG